MKVRIITGATHAYAAIEDDGISLDVQLSPGRSAAVSLDESATELHIQAQRLLRRAEVMRAAAHHLAQPLQTGAPEEVE